MLAKMPPYMLESDGTLKEWAWPTLARALQPPARLASLRRLARRRNRSRSHAATGQSRDDRQSQTHVRHDEPPRSRAKSSRLMPAAIALWSGRGSKTTSSWTSSCGNCSSRATSARRSAVRASPMPRLCPMRTAAFPAIIMEMLAYSRPGVIEVLPALPPSLVKGSINGMLARTFAQNRQTGLGHGSPNRGPDNYLLAKAGHYPDCPARDRRDFRTRRRAGDQTQVGRGQLQLEAAGRKAGRTPFEAGAASPAGLGQLSSCK